MGGAFIAWAFGAAYDVYVQHITAAGQIAPGWPGAGVAASTAPDDQFVTSLVGDGSGGMILVWNDFRQGATNSYDVYAQHVLGTGVVDPNWPISGLAIAAYPQYQWFTSVVSDGAEGAFITWEDERNGGPGTADVYLQHVHQNGTLAPGWPTGGKPICTAPGEQLSIFMLADGAGGVFLAWGDTRNWPTTAADIYAIRLTSSGDPADGWPEGGTPICQAPGIQGTSGIASDGSDGIYVTWQDYRTQPPSASNPDPYADVYLQHVNGSGLIAAGWPVNGFPVCIAPDLQQDIHLTADGSGGALLVWSDLRSFFNAYAYVQRVTSAGTVAPGWPLNGLQACTASGYQSDAAIAADGLGGAYVAFSSLTNFYQVYAQHLTPTGGIAAGWPAEGTRLALTSGEQQHPQMIADGYGGAIVTWDDSRPFGIYAQQLMPGGPTPVPVLVSLVSTEATSERVELVWSLAGSAGLSSTVERRTETTEWQRLGSAAADGTGQLRYADRTVDPGTRYAYRLGYKENGNPIYSAETWVDVPAAARLALAGFQPNPAMSGELQVAFALPSAEPATVELLDVTGRRVLARDVGSLGEGNHLLRLGASARLNPGVYWLRLEQAGRRLLAKGIVAR